MKRKTESLENITKISHATVKSIFLCRFGMLTTRQKKRRNFTEKKTSINDCQLLNIPFTFKYVSVKSWMCIDVYASVVAKCKWKLSICEIHARKQKELTTTDFA